MKCEWDPAKNDRNIRKHGIAFEDAAAVFEHPMLGCIDRRQDYGEERWVGIGMLREVPVVVVYTEHDDRQVRRLISARKATRHEQAHFEKALGN